MIHLNVILQLKNDQMETKLYYFFKNLDFEATLGNENILT